MDNVLLAARVLLAIVFAVAGVAKLADPARSRETLNAFGVPWRLARPLAVVLPLFELALAAALFPTETLWWASVGALGLLVIFSTGVAINLALGRTPDCHCFGQLLAGPVGWSTLLRNGLLASMAGALVLQGPAYRGVSAVEWLGELRAFETVILFLGFVALGVMVAEAWLLLRLLEQNGRLLVRLDSLEAAGGVKSTLHSASAPSGRVMGLPVGAPAPGFDLSGPDGARATLESLRGAGKPVMLIFTDPGCVACKPLIKDVGRWQRQYGADLTIAVIQSYGADRHHASSRRTSLANVLGQKAREIAAAYKVTGTPSAVIVSPDGRIASPLSSGVNAIHDLLTFALSIGSWQPASKSAHNGNGGGRAAASSTPAPGIGESAPTLPVRRLTGEAIDLRDAYRGTETLVVFWNPACGFCTRMLPDLKAWEASPPSGAPELLIVSTGSPAANAEMGFRSLVLLDDNFSAGRAFGAHGTPSAILLDRDGKIASTVAVGAQAVLALAAESGAQQRRRAPHQVYSHTEAVP